MGSWFCGSSSHCLRLSSLQYPELNLEEGAQSVGRKSLEELAAIQPGYVHNLKCQLQWLQFCLQPSKQKIGISLEIQFFSYCATLLLSKLCLCQNLRIKGWPAGELKLISLFLPQSCSRKGSSIFLSMNHTLITPKQLKGFFRLLKRYFLGAETKQGKSKCLEKMIQHCSSSDVMASPRIGGDLQTRNGR